MNEERTGKCLQQVEHIHGQLWHRYSITVNQVMTSASTKRNPLFSGFLVSSNPLSRKSWVIGTTSSGISYQLRDIHVYFICRCCWNVATYNWKVHNGKIEIISFVVKFKIYLLWWPSWISDQYKIHTFR
jgi:hypothetical protein